MKSALRTFCTVSSFTLALVASSTLVAANEHLTMKFDKALLKAEEVYTFNNDQSTSLILRSGVDTDLVVKFASKVKYPVKGTSLDIQLPAGIQRSTKGNVSLSGKASGELQQFNNEWDGTSGKSQIISSLEVVPDDVYQLVLPVVLKAGFTGPIPGAITATMTQAPSVDISSSDRVVQSGSTVVWSQKVEVQSRPGVVINDLVADRQQVMDGGKSFTLRVVASGAEASDTLKLTDNSGAVTEMKRLASCDSGQASDICFTATLPISSNPLEYGLTADLYAAGDGKTPRATKQLVVPLNDKTSTFPFSMQCLPGMDSKVDKNSISAPSAGCKLSWGSDVNPAMVPFLASNNWLSLTALENSKRLSPEGTKKIIGDLRKDLAGYDFMIFTPTTGGPWHTVKPFVGSNKLPEFVSALPDDETGLMNEGIFPQYGTLTFYFWQ